MGFSSTNPLAIPTSLDTDALNTSLADYRGTLVDNVYNSNTVLALLSQNGGKRMVDGGMSIVETLIRAKQDDGGFYLGNDVLNNTQGDDLATVEYQWQNLYEPISISRDEERQNSGSAHKIISLIGSKMTRSEMALSNNLEQALSTPVAGANKLVDLETLVNTGTLGSIAGATYTFWQATVTASGAFATQGLSDMTTATYAVASGSNRDMPTVYLTNSTVFQKYGQTRLPLERFMNTNTANAGFQNLTFLGKPVVYGTYVGSGLLFGLNQNYISLVVDTETDMVSTPFAIPTNQTVKVAFILWRGNMTTNNRRRNFKLTGIS